MNPFEKFGITHLSASSSNLYVEQPAKWCLQYLYKIWDESGSSPAVWRGSAVEAGLDWWLYQREDQDAQIDALTKAHARFEKDAAGEIRDDIDRERDAIEPMLNRAIERLMCYSTPEARQLKIEYWIEGIEVPIIGYIDYVFGDCVLDLKTTHRIALSGSNLRQVSLYSKAKNKPGQLLYVSTKRSELIEIPTEETERHIRIFGRHAHSIRALLALCPDKETASSMFVPDYDHPYHWKSDALRQKAEEIWQ